jgi:hypothetical protein
MARDLLRSQKDRYVDVRAGWAVCLCHHEDRGEWTVRHSLKIGALMVTALLFGHHAYANPCPPGNPPTNCAPPSGALLDLAGTPVPHTYQQYSTSFVASNASTNVSFSFREDPAFLGLDDVSVTTGGGPNLLTNGDFESGPLGANAPAGWTYLNAFGAAAAGVVASGGSPARTADPTTIAMGQSRRTTGSPRLSQPLLAARIPSASG